MRVALVISLITNLVLAGGWLWFAGKYSTGPAPGNAAIDVQAAARQAAFDSANVNDAMAGPQSPAAGDSSQLGVSSDNTDSGNRDDLIDEDEPSDERESTEASRWTIPLPDTHRGFFESPKGLPELRAELDAEEDTSWGEVVEGLLGTSIAGHRLAESVSVLNIECRQTLCELIGTAYGENGGKA